LNLSPIVSLLTFLRYLAILAGRLGLTVPQLKEELKRLIVFIIAHPISSDELDNFLKAVVKKYTGNSETRMYDPASSTSHCKT
jgi:DNA-binding cell septation regulator SpoVG